ncbi:hypothetical protein [Litorivivens sp.]|uniref:hypothetical protein n=1 Tax=Litorivivens sp. TaxID=2020868 RepID=UPI0035691B02
MTFSYLVRLSAACLTLVCLFSGHTLAQGAAQELAKLESRQSALLGKMQQLRQESQDLSETMANTEPADGPEKTAYEEAVAIFEEASETYEAEPTSTNKSRLRNAEFKLHLAERKYRSGSEELRKLEARQDAVETELIAVRRELDTIAERIPRLEQQVAVQRAREREQAEAARRAAAAQARNESKATQQADAPQPAPAPAGAQHQNTASAKTAALADPIELDKGFVLLTNKAQVLTELANLQLRIGGDSLKIRSNKILNVRHFVDGKEAEKNSHRFKGLGNYQYRATAVLHEGENRIRVSFSRWNIDMPADFAGQELVILMDASDRNSPKIVCYPSALDP